MAEFIEICWFGWLSS